MSRTDDSKEPPGRYAARFVIRLDPSRLENPDLDLRYVLPELLRQRSGGAIRDDGYDYTQGDRMLIFLGSDGTESALEALLSVLRSERVLGNDLGRGAVAAVSLLAHLWLRRLRR